MAPRRKRQRLSEDGTSAVTAVSDPEEPAVDPIPAAKTSAKTHKQLFVRSLATTVTSDDLTDYFSENFPIKHALVVLDKETKESKGYGFVTFADADDAQRAKEELDGTTLKGKKIRIDIAESRHRDTEGELPGAGGPSAGEKRKAERELQKKENQTPKLIVRNLPWSIKTPEQLQKHFLSFGKIHFVKLPKLPSGELRGFAFVAMRGKKNAEKAMEHLNGKEIDGRQIAVDWAVDKETWQEIQKKDRDGGEEEIETDATSSVVTSDSEDEDVHSDEESEEESNTDYEDVSDDDEGGVPVEEEKPKTPEYTVFIRNLPFTVDDDILFEHFRQFGPIGYARVVLDRETERPKGTGFVRFVREQDMVNCLKGVPRIRLTKSTTARRDGTEISVTHSVLEDEDADPTGKYTMDGRILHITQAVDRSEATRLTAESAASRFARDKDKRRLYLLSEGTIDAKSPLHQHLSPSERKMREESATLRRKQIQDNPSLHLSLTRLSVRNIPRSVTSKDLKALARQAVVGFAADVKSGKRAPLSQEETRRGGVEMMNAERVRKAKGKGIVKQAKVVFETPAGSKLDEETSAAGAGRSRGYGFIEYYTHRSALMGLRWLNGHAVEYKVKGDQPKSKKAALEAMQDRKKRLIVEFAIENANVVARRSGREAKAREQASSKVTIDDDGSADLQSGRGAKPGKKRKRESGVSDARPSPSGGGKSGSSGQGQGSGAETGSVSARGGDGRMKRRIGIIQKKREARRARKRGKA